MSKKLKIVGLAVFAVCAFMAVSASGASAIPPNWTVETTGGTVSIPSAGSSIGCELMPTSTEATSTLEVPGLLTLSGKGLHVEGCALTGPETDTVKKITFTNVVVGNVNCQVRGLTNGDAIGTISTVPLASKLVRIGTITYDTFTPEAETNGLFVEIEVTPKSGVSCPVSGKYKIKGSVNATVPASGTLATERTLIFNKPDEEVTKASDKLTFGPGAVESFLTVTAALRQTNDLKWGVDW